MEKENFDYKFKLIIIGNSNTGKSCLLHYLIENERTFCQTSLY